ncbi:sensor histidine kinase [Rhodohalobacter sp. SW132]|uniref:sensor histidine kinase n=1 Tax=Rhodohalobacter sp. SW132 TaxID=2293433 RepID=UPI001313FD65|nr:sensor histidine kinase [Rhodohalobacter sp. SW132]
MTPFRSYSIEHGLSESVVHSMLQDESGYIWLGTGFGLNRFDGVRFTQFYQEHGLPNNRVNELFQDYRGRIWIGTDSGLAFYENGEIHSPEQFNSVNESVILSIVEDENRNIWVATEGNGLWRYDRQQRFENITHQHGYRNMQVRSLAITQDGMLWLGTSEGLFSFNGNTFRKYRSQNGYPEVPMNDMTVDQDDVLWIASNAGLIKKEGEEFQIFHEAAGLNECRLNSVSITGEGSAWVSSDAGASYFDGHSFTNYTTEDGLNAVIVHETMIDREGNVWLGTLGAGANIFLGELFQNYNVDTGITNNVVTGFEEDRLGNIWIATYGGGVLRYDGEEFEHFSESDGLIDNKVYTIFEDSQNRIWIGARAGLTIYENGEFTPLPESEFPFQTIRKVYEDEDTGDFWIATYNSGVIRYDGESYEQFNTSSGLLNNTVMDIKKDEEGDFWFATYGGVAVLKDGMFEHLTIADGLPNNGVIHINIDVDGIKWFSTFSGLAYYDGENVRSIISDNQSGTITYFSFQDQEEQYWVGTNRGLYRFNPVDFFSARTRVERLKSFKLFDQNQGLVANELNAGASFVASDGSVWLGTVEGLSRFFPDRVRINETPPGIEFEEVMMSGRQMEADQSEEFNHDQNFFQVSFHGLSFESPAQILYEYRLEGLEDEWQTTRERTVRYTSLPPGNYNFRVRSYNADGFRSTDEASISFLIKSPIWMQWWFLVLITAGIIGLIFFYYRFFKTRKQVDIERMRVQIASDLHDDVGSSLTELALQTDFLRAGNVSDELRDTLKQLGDQSRKIVSSLDDIVWSIDARNDTAGDVTDRMQDYVNHVFRAGTPDVHYHFENIKMDDRLPVHVKENIYLIFKESVNNIAKHSNADTVDITFVYNGKNFELKVSDNGTQSNGKRKSGQGLRNIELRSRRIGADVQIYNSDGFTVHVKGTV